MITYPPLDVLKPVVDDVWIVDSGPLRAFGIPLPVRMTVIRLHSGDLVLHSPTRCTPGLQDALERIGPIRHLVGPTFAHWKFLSDWQRACRNATTWAAPGLRRRWPVRRAGLSLDRDLDPGEPGPWSGEIGLTIVPGGMGFREAAFFHRPSRTLVLTDLIVNLEAGKLPRLLRLPMWLTGSLAPNGSTPIYLRALLALRRKAARQALEKLVALEPERVIFAHGKWFDGDAASSLSQSLRWAIR